MEQKEEYIKQQSVQDLKKELPHLATQVRQVNNLELFLIRKKQTARLKARITICNNKRYVQTLHLS